MNAGNLSRAIADDESGCFGEEECNQKEACTRRDSKKPEDPAPARVLDQDTAEHRADGGCYIGTMKISAVALFLDCLSNWKRVDYDNDEGEDVNRCGRT